MKLLYIITLIFLILFISGCSQTVVKYQCADGTFVDSANSCSSVNCKIDCPQLDCANCPLKIEYKDKIVEKTVEVIKYQCYDSTFETSKFKCKSPEEVNTGLIDGNINITINSASFYSDYREITNENMDAFVQWFILEDSFEYLKLDITVKNNYGNITSLEIKIKDKEGYTYSETPNSIMLLRDYLPIELNKGDTIRGSRIFEVRKNAQFEELLVEAIVDSVNIFKYKQPIKIE